MAQGLVVAGLATRGVWAGAGEPAAATPGTLNTTPPANRWPGFPRQDPALVQEFVGASHGNLAKVRELLAQHPALAKCSVDWAYGDWESALGAASHVGHREIAQLLIEHGARLDVFAATMLGMLDAVKAMVAAQPGIQRTPGPHGITLLNHAKAGKNEAMIAYISTLDGADAKSPPPLSAEEMKAYLGTYTPAAGPGAAPDAPGAATATSPLTIVVGETRFGMAIRVDGSGYAPGGKGADRTLMRTGEHQFHPIGAPNVRVAFTVAAGRAARVEVSEGSWYADATRA